MNNQSLFKIITISFLLFSGFAQAIRVLPILPSEGVWNVTTRIGIELDAIVCQARACDILITTTDIANGGIYTITTDNTYYCLAESAVFNTTPAIAISANNVTLDLNGHSLDGDTNGVNAIELTAGIENVTIKNGIINNCASAIFDTPGLAATMHNIAIKDIEFNNNSTAAIRLTGAGSSRYDVSELLIEDCRAVNSIKMTFSGISGIVRGCSMEDEASSSLISMGGPNNPTTLVADRFLIQDCSSAGNGVFGHAFFVQYAHNVGINNCIAEGAIAAILVEDCDTINMADCFVQASDPNNSGIQVQNSVHVIVERCVALGASLGFAFTGQLESLKVKDCIAQGNGINGFFAQANTAKLLFSNCCALSNGLSGFLVRSSSNLEGASVVFNNCVAQNNAGDGFTLANISATDMLNNIIFDKCIAQDNYGGTFGSVTYPGDGFAVGTTFGAGSGINAGPIMDVVFHDCASQNNAHDGFAFALTTTKVKILNCLAMMNTNTGINNLATDNNYVLGNSSILNGIDYFGVTDPNKVASSNTPGALLGAGRWVNART